MMRMKMLSSVLIALGILSACDAPEMPDHTVSRPENTVSRPAPIVYDQTKEQQEAKGDAAAKAFHHAYTVWMEKARQLLTTVQSLESESRVLGNSPGWAALQQIIQSYVVIRAVEGEAAAHKKLTAALSQWKQTWTGASDELFTRSRTLSLKTSQATKEYVALWKDQESLGVLQGISMNYMVAHWSNLEMYFDSMYNAERNKVMKALSDSLVQLIQLVGPW